MNMALVCPNPRERLGPISTLPHVGSCTHYVDAARSYRTEARMSENPCNPCHSCSPAGDSLQEAGERGERRGELLKDTQDHGPVSVLEFATGAKWNAGLGESRLNAAPANSSWSSYNSNSSSFSSSSGGWMIPPLSVPTAFHSDTVFNDPSGLQSQSLSGAFPARHTQLGSNSGFSSGAANSVHQLYQNPPAQVEAIRSACTWEKIADGPQQKQLPQYESYRGYSSSGQGQGEGEPIKDPTTINDDTAALTAWVDGMITELMEAMPGVPIEHLFTNLSEVLAPGNLQLERVIEARFQTLFGFGGRVQNFGQAGSSRGGKRTREKLDLEGGDQWGDGKLLLRESRNLLELPSHGQHVRPVTQVVQPSPLRSRQQFFANSQKVPIDTLQLSLEPRDDRHLRHHVQQTSSMEDFQQLRSRDTTSFTQHQAHYQEQPHQQPQHHQTELQAGYSHNYSQLNPSSSSSTYYAPQTSSFQETQPVQPARISPAPATKVQMETANTGDEEGLQLLALLLQCAEAVSADNYEEANSILPQLSELATPYGSSVQRVVAYFAEGMASRLVTSCLGICSPLPGMQRVSNQKIVSAVQVFNDICPFVKFSHFTANQAIVEAFEGMKDVHIIDIDIMHGLQWPALFHTLASRPGGPPQVRITGLGTSIEALEATGKRLSDFAETLGLPFEFIPVADRIGNVDPSTLKVRFGDTLAVHWMHHSLYDVTGSDPRTLSLLQSLSPKVITIVEQDLRHGGSFLSRFVEALHYYSALFDSLGASYPEDSSERHVVEQQLLSCEIKNILAVGGPARTGEVKFENWMDELNKAGFKPVSLSGKAATQAALLLGMYPCEGYTLLEQRGSLKLGWKDLCLFTASAWRCNEIV